MELLAMEMKRMGLYGANARGRSGHTRTVMCSCMVQLASFAPA